ncbi:iron complex outermembrane receptor protein [Roseivirga pacifica]|uniref:Iron complex outermembrane recepter protein n=1 Tax=Roseivirga pacifica TaxID=1267423 RepID=A0A1I0NJ66_9BACT|nr:TonB-dependent receptor [Roseivirga pacifica]RKQ51243.1 iron complex outermembrane receptor protein [Roseivirga pacifica]SEW01528.1 iron complex outermembrane recepter protein [Roseivirga pacifica]
MKKLVWIALMLPIALAAKAQYVVKGTVRDASDNSVAYGASVVLKELNRGNSTNTQGEYSISNVPAGDYTIVISMIGYITKEQVVKVDGNETFNFNLNPSERSLGDVVVTGTRASENTPTTYTNVSKEEIEKQNLGQDMPFLLNFTPSVVVTSDAGAGVGYTGIRVRGSDPTRINVTINGIPVNDSESQGTFWVNMPDFASSTSDIQIQRGVGTSTNGAGAFGASLNILTNGVSREPSAKVGVSYGSFNTQRYNATFNTGLLNDHFAFEGRLSKIMSDGYIDRASSDLQSYYLSGEYLNNNTSIKFITFSGEEKTYQSWWGTPQARLENDEAGMQEVIANNGYTQEQADNLLNSGRTFNYYLYDNQTDNYGQDHYQLHLNQNFSANWNLHAGLHYTKGAGYYEEFRNDDDLADYGLNDVQIGSETITSTDLIRRRWLDNDFYGVTYDLHYSKSNIEATLGGAYNEYDGLHYGEVIWAEYASNGDIRHRYYESQSDKSDFNTYLKVNLQATDKLNVYGDVQIRAIDYRGLGVDNDQRVIDFDNQYTFFNPKFGAIYELAQNTSVYASFAIGNKEPNRSDIIDAAPGTEPKHETLNNLEVGFRKVTENVGLEVNYYLMDYKNQLVLTGDVNDVGGSIRTNVPDSYRMGVEVAANIKLAKKLYWNVNGTLSRNKIKAFEELIFDYGPAFDEYNEVRTEFEDTDISFSPSLIAGSQLSYRPTDGLELSFMSKYVGDQYLDNTSNEGRKIDAFFVNDIRINYGFDMKGFKQVNLNLLVNNVFNTMYESNGYTFGYFAGASYEVRENYLYPQAGTNFLLSLSLAF